MTDDEILGNMSTFSSLAMPPLDIFSRMSCMHSGAIRISVEI